MRSADLARAGLRHHRRSHIAVALGVAVATAVLTGALLVGDSVRGSLRDLTLKRLGNIDQVLVTAQPFRAALAEEIETPNGRDAANAAWLLRGSTSSGTIGDRRYASQVSVVGFDDAFYRQQISDTWGCPLPGDGQVVVTAPLAAELRVAIGDELVVRLPAVSAQPADSTLGEKADTTVSRRLEVVGVVAESAFLARFALQPSQRPPRTAFVSIATVQRLLEQPDTANTLLVTREASGAGPESHDALLARSLKPRLEDYGLTVERLDSGVVQKSSAVQIESSQLVLPDAVVDAAQAALGDQQRAAITYLANTIQLGDKSIPYSTITGIASSENGPLLSETGAPIQLADDEIVLNDWAVDRLAAKPGDTITVTYYEPESTHGKLVEAPPLPLTLKAVVPLDGPAGDPRLTPVLKGVTDARSINDWDLPFDLIEPIGRADEDYWDDHSTTPKAFVSLSLAKQLWSTRWGSISLLRVPDASVEQVEAKLQEAINPADMGYAFQAVKRLGLQASAGSTPFDGLFFGFSLFLIAAAVLLIVLLFGLGVEQRAKEIGLLLAVGWDQAAIRHVLRREALLVSTMGAVVGVPAGVFYAWLMIQGLTTLWVEAIVSPFLSLHVTTKSLATGAIAGVLVAWLATRWALRSMVSRPPRALLAGASSAADNKRQGSLILRVAGPLCFAFSIGLGISAVAAGGSASTESRAGMFFGSGALILAALVLWIRGRLLRGGRQSVNVRFDTWLLALKNTARAPGRSMLTVALVGSASFLILAISAFRLAPSEEGTGGFVLVAQSDQPIHFDLNTPEGRLELGFSQQDEQLLDQFNIQALRVHDGEDASCLNLYQTRQPRVLGVPDESQLLERFTYAVSQSEIPNPQSAIPTVVDFNTAMYSLKLYGGVGSKLTIRDGVDREVDLEVAGLLKNSILQGDLLVSEPDFLNLYPATGGYRFFLIEPKHASRRPTAAATGGRRTPAGDDDVKQLAEMLEDRLSDFGFDTENTEQRLSGFLAVQNTYLSTFQSLGALGLLLGAVGVAVVQVRNLAERSGELALMRAAGFDTRTLQRLVLRENLMLLGGGLAVGALAALVALAPQALTCDTRLPWTDSGLLLAAIAAIGLTVGSYATRNATRVPVIAALRGD